jgi:hypothetical protein
MHATLKARVGHPLSEQKDFFTAEIAENAEGF